MICGIGIDIVRVDRIAQAMARHGCRFTDRIFTASERSYCQSHKRVTESFAARFAVKEAAFKALGRGWDECGGFTSVEVLRASSGCPSILFSGLAERFFRDMGAVSAFVSITHDAGLAAAVVVLER